jgi:hypothetical protein
MITDNFKNKILKSIKENIYCFSFTVNNEAIEREPHSIEIKDKSIKVSVLLDNRDVGRITNIKLLDIDREILFETNAIYYKNDDMGVYISFSISDIMEVSSSGL